MNWTLKPMLPLVVLVIAGCAGGPLPAGRAVSSEAAIRSAREVGAESVPKASLYLKLSEEQVAKAKAMMVDGYTTEVDLMLQRAQADAELALALTRESTAEAEARQLLTQVQQLRAGR